MKTCVCMEGKLSGHSLDVTIINVSTCLHVDIQTSNPNNDNGMTLLCELFQFLEEWDKRKFKEKLLRVAGTHFV